MAPNSSHPHASSPLPPSSSSHMGSDPHIPNSDSTDDHGDVALWRWRYLALREEGNKSSKSSKRKSEHAMSTTQIGRGIRKVVFICREIKDLVLEADKHLEYLEDSEALMDEFDGLNEEDVVELKRNHKALSELCRLIPNFQKKIDEGLPEELTEFYGRLQLGANNARSDDLNRIRECLAEWLNQAHPTPSPLLQKASRDNRGLPHDVTGRLLCPAEFDWDDLEVRAKLRAGEEDHDWLSSYHARAFYANHKADWRRLEVGFLKSTLLVKVYKSIFTSPSSAKDVSEDDEDEENAPPAKVSKTSQSQKKATKRNVASKLNMNDKVTPRSIAYAAVQLHFNLQTADRWFEIYGGLDYRGLYNYIVDFFEDVQEPAMKKRTQDLLNWWSMKVFPAAAVRRQSNTSASRKAMQEQRAART